LQATATPNLHNAGGALRNLLAFITVDSPGVGDAIPALERMLGSPFPDTRITAAQALVNMSMDEGSPMVNTIAGGST
jgi:hypothetical protein